MPKALAQPQIEHFHEQGFLSPVPVLREDEVAYFRRCLEAFEAKFPDERLKLKSKSHLLCPWIEEIARHDGLLDVYQDLIGPNILCYSMAFRIKDPDGKTHAGWHQDGAHNPIRPILVIGALALADCTLEHGCLKVIPGSHKTGTLDHIDTGNPESILTRGQYIPEGFEEATAVEMPLKAGEIGLFNAQIIHGSGINTAHDRRVILLVEMMPTHVEARAHRDSAMLVRGVDNFGRVDFDPSPREEFGPNELAAWRNTSRKTGQNVFANSPLRPNGIYSEEHLGQS